MIDNIIDTVAWVHHKITNIHPFQEGNGRTARLSANLILECYGLVGISIKIERENKNKYRQALAQADKMNDLEPLKALIYEGIIDRLNNIPMFFDKSKH
jgi:Fic family protein